MVPLITVDGPAPGALNMERDLSLLAAVEQDSRVRVRVYRFVPACLSLGRLQPESDVEWERCRADGIDVVRRPTGGRAILHDDEVTYALACRATDPLVGGDVLTSCARIHALIAGALARLGILTTPRTADSDERAAGRARAAIADCFARPASHELLDPDGLKIVGSAQCRRGAALLQHGSVLLAAPRAGRYLRQPTDDGALTRGLRHHLGRPVEWDEVAAAIASGFAAAAAPEVVR